MARLLVLGNVNLDESVETAGPLVGGGREQARRRGVRLGGGGGIAAAMRTGAAWAARAISGFFSVPVALPAGPALAERSLS